MKKLLLIALLSGVLAQGLEGAARGVQVKRSRDSVAESKGDGKFAGAAARPAQVLAMPAVVRASDLHGAVESGDVLMVAVLLDAGDEKSRMDLIKAVNDDRETVLHRAAFHKRPAIVRTVLDYIPRGERYSVLEMRNIHGETALHVAARSGDVGVVFKLLGAISLSLNQLDFIKIKNQCEVTALHVAAGCGRANVIEALLVFLKEQKKRLEIVKMCDQRGATALHYAADCGHADVVDKLLGELSHDGRWSLIQQSTNKGATALHYAADRGHIDVVLKLLQGLTPEQRSELVNKNYCGRAAWELARDKNHATIARWADPRADNECWNCWWCNAGAE